MSPILEHRIRKFIKEVLSEAVPTSHFKERYTDRIESEYTTFSKEPKIVKDKIIETLNFIESINFPGQDNIGVLIYKTVMPNKYERWGDGKLEKSVGRFVWVVIRANDIETIVFGDQDYVPRNTQIQLTINFLKRFIEDYKNGDTNLTEKDINLIKTKTIPSETQVVKQEQPVVNISGTKWIVDKESGKLFQKNNPQKSAKIEDVIFSLPENIADKVLAYME